MNGLNANVVDLLNETLLILDKHMFELSEVELDDTRINKVNNVYERLDELKAKFARQDFTITV